ncbi:MAG: hypothetical protein HPY64_08055 [Anaerolineae bacterium]|nr:hypothetical protein [Anaerolineae bacterium]
MREQTMAAEPHVTDQLAEYALGVLPEDEAVAVIEHLAVCAGCRGELARHQQVVAALMLSAPPHSPARETRGRLMARIGGQKAAPPRRTSPLRALLDSRMPGWVGVALGSLVIVLAMLLLFHYPLSVPQQALQAPLYPLAQENAESNPYLVKLEATDRMPRARGALLIRTDGQHAILIVEGLEPFENQDYQLWLNRDNNPVSAGYFSVSDSGLTAIPLTMPDLVFTYFDMKLTLEPSGGSILPTGVPVMRGFLDLVELLRLFE